LLLKSGLESVAKLRPPPPIETICHDLDDQEIVPASPAPALKQATGRSTGKRRQSAKPIYKRVVDFVRFAFREASTVVVCQRQKDFDQKQSVLRRGKSHFFTRSETRTSQSCGAWRACSSSGAMVEFERFDMSLGADAVGAIVRYPFGIGDGVLSTVSAAWIRRRAAALGAIAAPVPPVAVRFYKRPATFRVLVQEPAAR
jgi:hypothetical protein